MYASWPKIISRKERTLVVLSYGHRYDLQPVDDTKADTPLVLFKDGEPIADIQVEKGRVVDFCVCGDLVAIATVEPAGLYLCRTWKESQVLYLRFSLENENTPAASSVTLGNYGSNITVVWHGPEPGPVFIGMVSGKDAFRFDYKPLQYYNEKGHLRMYIRKEGEKVLAVPHFPRQNGVVAMLSNQGLKFYSLRPFYTINKLTDNLVDSPMFYNSGIQRPDLPSIASRIQFDAYTMNVKINNNHIVMKYDVLDQIDSVEKDWIKVTVNGTVVGPNDMVYLTPVNTDQTLRIDAVETLGDIEIKADLPVSLRLSTQLPNEALPSLGIGLLMKGQKADILMRPMQCLTPYALARFIEKFNIKIRAEVWS